MFSNVSMKSKFYIFGFATTVIVFLISIISILTVDEIKKSYSQSQNVSNTAMVLDALLIHNIQMGHALKNVYIEQTDNVAIKSVKDNISKTKTAFIEYSKLDESGALTMKQKQEAYLSSVEKLITKADSGVLISKDEIMSNTNDWRDLKDLIVKAKDSATANTKDTNEAFFTFVSTSEIVLILTSIVGAALVVGFIVSFIFGIKNNIEALSSGMFSFFDFLHKKTAEVKPINLDFDDEFGKMAKVINENISIIQKSLKEDEDFIADVKIFAKELGDGNFLVKLEKNPHTQSLQELKEILTKVQYDLEHNICRDLHILHNIIESFKRQDFTARFPNAYGKVAVAINEASDTISQMLVNNLKNGYLLRNEAFGLKKQIDELSMNTNSQAASLEEIAASIEEMSANISATTDKSQEMARLANITKESTQGGIVLSDKTVLAIDDIVSATTAINEAVAIIDNIAFQTNILSLNAAVEAATAGEAGKGFAVVAGEVRNLAARSAEAAKEIASLAQTAKNKAQDGKATTDAMQKNFKELVAKIDETSVLIDGVAKASVEQINGIHQINSSISTLDVMTQGNASAAQKVTAIAENVANMADNLVNDAGSKKFTGKDSAYTKPEVQVVNAKESVKASFVKSIENQKASKHTYDHEAWQTF